MESEEVAAVRVRRTGESASKARKMRIDDLTVLAPSPEMSLSVGNT